MSAQQTPITKSLPEISLHDLDKLNDIFKNFPEEEIINMGSPAYSIDNNSNKIPKLKQQNQNNESSLHCWYDAEETEQKYEVSFKLSTL